MDLLNLTTTDLIWFWLILPLIGTVAGIISKKIIRVDVFGLLAIPFALSVLVSTLNFMTHRGDIQYFADNFPSWFVDIILQYIPLAIGESIGYAIGGEAQNSEQYYRY
jgi:hypothetical protein